MSIPLKSQLVVGVSANGYPVVDRPNSHNKLWDRALARAISECNLELPFEKKIVDFGELVDFASCIETGPNDTIVFAQRKGRRGLTRFVLDRKPILCSSVVLILKRAEDSCPPHYVLVTAFCGEDSEPEPWDRAATERSAEFWKRHALIWNCEPVDPATVTAKCPW